MFLWAPTNGRIASRKTNTSDIDRRDISTETILFALLKKSVVFLRFLSLALRLARPRFICLRIIILRLARLYAAVLRFERLHARPDRKKDRSKIKSLLGIESGKV